jgi:hypothetical protein
VIWQSYLEVAAVSKPARTTNLCCSLCLYWAESDAFGVAPKLAS